MRSATPFNHRRTVLGTILLTTLFFTGCVPLQPVTVTSPQPVDWVISGALVNSIPALDLASGTEPPDLPASLINVVAKGGPANATITGLSYALPSTDSTGCAQDAVAALQVVENPFVVTFGDGTLLYANSTPQGGTICLFANGSSTAQISLQISGGSGKYDGASGSLELAVKTQPIGRSLLAEEGTVIGEIVLSQ